MTISARGRRLADSMRAWPRARIPLATLWRMLDEADPGSRTDARRRTLLADLLAELVTAEVISLPSVRSFDRTENPHLPRFVTVRRTVQARPQRRDVVWHPELAWVPGARLAPAHFEALAAINTWLFRGRDHLVVPLRERSLEILGDEKALEKLLNTNMFAPDRLTVDVLRTRRAVPRLLSTPVGDGDELLVAENSDTFDSLVRAAQCRGGPIGVVAWGAGAGFEASVLSIAEFDRPVSAIWYFGDLDRNGLRIPASASATAVAANLPPVRPAVELYDALLRLGTPAPAMSRVPQSAAEDLVAWLAPSHRARAIELLTGGQRLAQEAVGLRYLLSMTD